MADAIETGTAGAFPPLDNPYNFVFGSDLRRWQCLLCLCPDPVSVNAVSLLSYHLMLLRSAKPLQRLCEKPWGDPKAKWRYDTHENISSAPCLPLSSVKLQTKYLKEKEILDVSGPHFPKYQNTRATFYRLSDQAQFALYALTEPFKNLFNGMPSTLIRRPQSQPGRDIGYGMRHHHPRIKRYHLSEKP